MTLLDQRAMKSNGELCGSDCMSVVELSHDYASLVITATPIRVIHNEKPENMANLAARCKHALILQSKTTSNRAICPGNLTNDLVQDDMRKKERRTILLVDLECYPAYMTISQAARDFRIIKAGFEDDCPAFVKDIVVPLGGQAKEKRAGSV